MSVSALRAGVTVGKLRVHGGEEPLATRLAASRVLSGAELTPEGLPPAAVLVVRRLADPWPGRLDLRSLQADPSWQGLRPPCSPRLRDAGRPPVGRDCVGDG